MGSTPTFGTIIFLQISLFLSTRRFLPKATVSQIANQLQTFANDQQIEMRSLPRINCFHTLEVVKRKHAMNAYEMEIEGLTLEEYIEDKALVSRDHDEFYHNELAHELAALVRNSPTPLHVAMYGPWGSGKSSLCNLLKDELKEDRDVKFIRFDAWKFAKQPLQRHFISQSEKYLHKKNDKAFSKSLYQKTQHKELTIPQGDTQATLKRIVIFLLALIVIAIGTIEIIARVAEKPFGEVVDLKFLSSTILSASLLGVIISFTGGLFKLDVSESEASSDEQFEQLFRKLINKTTEQKDRVIFYIDELDRCNPRDVVSVLETIRTFLDVDRCVFIVAADQQVLEEALIRELPHAVPDDQQRPYYSSGAEYLDKIFQHQITIPPVNTPRLTEYARSLVSTKSGVWKNTEDLGELVSVLIPSNVKSPRRVKVLLNGFVTCYRTAKARHKADPSTTPDPDVRMLEFAKLSTLRLEFPLFYRNLECHPRLASLLTQYLLNNKAWGSLELEEQAKAFGIQSLVEGYAAGNIPIACNLSISLAAQSKYPSMKSTESNHSVEAFDSEKATEMGAERNDLLDYLEKTASIPGPSPDIIFGEGAGSSYGLPSDLADLIELDAVNNKYESLVKRIKILDSTEKNAVLRMLASLSRSLNGVEARNTLGIGLRLATQLSPSEKAASELVVMAKNFLEKGPLELTWLHPAFQVGQISGSQAGRILQERVLDDTRLHSPENADLAINVVKLANSYPDLLFNEIGNLILSRPPGFIMLLNKTDSIDFSPLISSLQAVGVNRLIDTWNNSSDHNDDWEETSSDAASSVSADFKVLVDAALKAANNEFFWKLLEVACDYSEVILISLWTKDATLEATTDHQARIIQTALKKANKNDWPKLCSLLPDTFKLNSEEPYHLLLRITKDLSEMGEWSDNSLALWEKLRSCWGDAKIPNVWDGLSTLMLDWSSQQRSIRHEILKVLSTLDKNNQERHYLLLSQDYVEAINDSANLTNNEHLELIQECRGNWGSIEDKEKEEIIAALQADPSPLSEDAKRCWEVSLAVASGAQCPFDEATVLASIEQGSAYDIELARLWLRSYVKEEAPLEAFILRLAQTEKGHFNKYRFSFSTALGRLESNSKADVLAQLFKEQIKITAEDAKAIFGESFDSIKLAQALAEQLREANNLDERAYLLEFWSLWEPKDSVARKELIQALAHVAAAGKQNFELMLRYIHLVKDPPRGTKTSFVKTIEERGKKYGLSKRANKAMAKVGLVKIKSSLFGSRTIITDNEEEDGEGNKIVN